MSLSDEKLVGRWEGEGTEVLCDVDADKVNKVKYQVKMTIKKVNTDIYRIKSKYYYVKDGKVFGTSYEADKLSSSEDYLFNKYDDKLFGSGILNEKDNSGRTIEHIHFNSDFSTMYYNYNTNEINNSLNTNLKKLTTSFNKLLGMKSGKISVAGTFTLKKK